MVFDEMPLWCLTGVDSMENERVLVWVFKIGFENLEDTWISQLLWKRGEKFRIRISKTKRKNEILGFAESRVWIVNKEETKEKVRINSVPCPRIAKDP